MKHTKPDFPALNKGIQYSMLWPLAYSQIKYCEYIAIHKFISVYHLYNVIYLSSRRISVSKKLIKDIKDIQITSYLLLLTLLHHICKFKVVGPW